MIVQRLKTVFRLAPRILERSSSSLLLAVIVFLLLTALVWAGLTEIDEVTRAQGKVVPSGSLQVLQSLEGGVIESINVSRGDTVSKNEVVMVLGGNLFEGSYQQSQQRLLTLEIQRERLQAEVDERAPEFRERHRQAASATVGMQLDLYNSRQAKLEAELQALERKKFQRQQELEEEISSRSTAERSLELLRSEIDILQPLVERDLASDLELLESQRRLAEAQEQLERAESGIKRLRSAIEEIADQRRATLSAFKTESLNELSRVAAEIGELTEMMPARAGQVERTNIRSPVDGTVNRVHFSTIGGVARSGDELIEIVPDNESLLVEAKIRPQDIGFIYPGQAVRVMLTAYDFARYGSLQGQVEVIGADAIEEPQTGEVYYPVEIRTDGQLLDGSGQPLTVMPGMVADVSILSGKRTVLDYLTEPVVKVKETAFRDR
jgi:adhesin transport system membrane fusion protein